MFKNEGIEMKYKVQITETLQRIIEVEASNESEAILNVKDKYKKEDIVLNETDYIDTEFDILDEDNNIK